MLICNEEAPLPVTITAASMSPAVASSKDVTTVSTTSSGSDSTVSKFLVHPTDNTPVRTIQKRTGAEWIACGCGQWLHEDCAEDVVLDDKGNERFCVFCLM